MARATTSGDRRADRTDHQGPGQPEQLDQDETGREGPDDGADGVRGIQPPERLAQVGVGAEVAGQRRQRRAHQDRRRSERERAPGRDG